MRYLIYVILLIFIFSNNLYSVENENSLPPGQLLSAPIIQISEKVIKPSEIFSSTIFNDDFESNLKKWSLSGSWSIGTPTIGPISGYNSTKCAATNLTSKYQNNANASLVSPSISLPKLYQQSSRIKLYFWEWFQTESSYDFGYVNISTDKGNTWTKLDTRSGTSAWRSTSIDLTSYAGKEVMISYQFVSNGSNVYYGWFIDNIQIIQEGTEPLETSITSINHQNFPFIYVVHPINEYLDSWRL